MHAAILTISMIAVSLIINFYRSHTLESTWMTNITSKCGASTLTKV